MGEPTSMDPNTGDWRALRYSCPEWCDWEGLGYELDCVVSEDRIEFKCPKCDEPVRIDVTRRDTPSQEHHTGNEQSVEGAIRAGGHAADTRFRFWFSDTLGLIRQRSTDRGESHPEVCIGSKWVTGSRYVMDAISGMGEDPWSCGEWADEWTIEQAAEYARTWGIELHGASAEG